VTLKELYSKMRNMVKIARVTIPDKDSGIDSIAQVDYMGKPGNAQMVMPYGLAARVPKGCTVLLFSIGGSSQNSAGIPTNPENRFRDLKEFEVKVGNFKNKNNVYFKEDGTVVVKAGVDGGDVIIENKDGLTTLNLNDDGIDVVGDFSISGNLNVDGKIEATGEINATGRIRSQDDVVAGPVAAAVSVALHVHSGIGSPPTKVPIP
jgi:hypothetical protein